MTPYLVFVLFFFFGIISEDSVSLLETCVSQFSVTDTHLRYQFLKREGRLLAPLLEDWERSPIVRVLT